MVTIKKEQEVPNYTGSYHHVDTPAHQGIVPWQCSGHTSATRGTEKILLLMLQVNQSTVGEAQSSSQEMVTPEALYELHANGELTRAHINLTQWPREDSN